MSSSNRSNVGLGCDIVTISRIERLLLDYPKKFRSFAFSSQEQRYCDEQAFSHQHYAARWAVKEAVIKAIGMPGVNPDLTSIELINEPTPQLSLSGDGLDLLAQKASKRDSSVEDTDIAVSMSHEREANLAVGWVLVFF